MVYLNKILKISDTKPPGTKEEILEVFFPINAKIKLFKEKKERIVVYSNEKNLKKIALCIAAVYKKAKKTLPKKIVVIGKKEKIKISPSEFYDYSGLWLWMVARIERQKLKTQI